MDKKHELDDILKKHMEFSDDEQPELNPAIQNELRKKVQLRKKQPKAGIINNLLHWLTLDIKLYQAGLAMFLLVFIFFAVSPSGTRIQNIGSNAINPDTTLASKSNSFKQDRFLVKNFSVSIN